MAVMLVHHNTFFNISDHMTPYIQREFKGSSAAENFSCGRTKTSAMINCIGNFLQEKLVTDMRSWPFSIMIDGSNDNGLAKMLPITVRIFDVNHSRIMTKFFDMNLVSGRSSGTAAAMFDSVDAQFTKHGIAWENVSGLGVDNTNANIGNHNSLKTRVLKKNNEVVVAGCPCHILHNAAGKAADAFATASGFDVECHCVDIFYWFDKSSKRKCALNEYYEFCDIEYQEIIKYISTRWLCTEKCINRELNKFDGLRSYFLSENERNERFTRLRDAFSNPMTELYMMFFKAVLPAFTNFNKFLQTEEPLIHCLHEQMQSFLHKLASKFVKHDVIQQTKQNDISLTKLDITLVNQKDDEDLTVGLLTTKRLNELLDEGDITNNDVDKFFDAVRSFYEAAYDYCIKWLPADDALYKNSTFIDFFKRNLLKFDHITELLAKFPKRFSNYIANPQELDALEEEYLIYQSLGETDIPQSIWDASIVRLDDK